jgi:hypothetical protein
MDGSFGRHASKQDLNLSARRLMVTRKAGAGSELRKKTEI